MRGASASGLRGRGTQAERPVRKHGAVRVVAATDKFRGTATAREVTGAVASAADQAGWACDLVPMADGGEGTLDALGGANRTTLVSGPLGDPIDAAWRLSGAMAVIEMATASGLELVGGPEGNDPLAASTYGTGELLSAALEAGARRIVVGVGGSATTDGGLGALRGMHPLNRMKAARVTVACDVRTRFVDAAEIFAPQKGATPHQVELLRRRLERLAQVYEDEHGVDVRDLEGSGAAGGLAGGLAAVGAELTSGFEAVSDEVDLYGYLEDADLVVTGEGFLDAQSFDGKVVGGVIELAEEAGVPVLVVAGEIDGGISVERHGKDVAAVSLIERYGEERAFAEPLACVEQVVGERLSE